MEFRTEVTIEDPGFRIEPCEEMLFVGSCFATEIGHRFQEECFRATVNPYGVMYNPASILHTVERWASEGGRAQTAFLTLGTNHIYRLKETGEIVDNCQKRPQSLFQEEKLSIEQCADYLRQTIDVLRKVNPAIHIIITVSPIRYRKYGYHESQLSKATLLLAISNAQLSYFPAYEIVLDELRDYRFYKADMLHPSEQAVDYIWERFSEVYLSEAAKEFIREWAPLRAALNHRPFDADSEAYRTFMDKTMLKVEALRKKYPTFALLEK